VKTALKEVCLVKKAGMLLARHHGGGGVGGEEERENRFSQFTSKSVAQRGRRSIDRKRKSQNLEKSYTSSYGDGTS